MHDTPRTLRCARLSSACGTQPEGAPGPSVWRFGDRNGCRGAGGTSTSSEGDGGHQSTIEFCNYLRFT